MELFRCVFIFLGVFLSALKVQSTRKVSISHTEGLCKKEDGRYWAIDTATKTSINNITQCDARADGESQKNANSKFQLFHVKANGIRYTCIQFTHPNTGAKYALKMVNQSRVVFEKHRCNGINDPGEFQFKEECYKSHGRLLVYKPFKNQSLCVSKDCVSQKLTLYKYNITQNGTKDTTCGGSDTTPFDRLCAFRPEYSRKTAQ